MDIGDYVFSPHARFEIARRGLSEEIVRAVVQSPGQHFEIRSGRVVYQSIVEGPDDGRLRLVRVFVDVDRVPAEIVTAYHTSRIGRYWRDSRP
jgi:hypothetical protein